MYNIYVCLCHLIAYIVSGRRIQPNIAYAQIMYILQIQIIDKEVLMSPVLTVVISIVVLIVGIAIGYVLRKNFGEKAIGSAEQQARNMILDMRNLRISATRSPRLSPRKEGSTRSSRTGLKL